jgi:hypothetical protein
MGFEPTGPLDRSCFRNSLLTIRISSKKHGSGPLVTSLPDYGRLASFLDVSADREVSFVIITVLRSA